MYLYRPIFLTLLFVLFGAGVMAQHHPSIIHFQDISPAALDNEQKIRYDRVLASGIYSSVQFVNVGSLEEAQVEDEITIALPNTPCDQNTFLASSIEYNSEEDYTWYGELSDKDSSSDCYKGSIMLISANGEHFGHFEVSGKTFEIIDLSSGLQVVAQVNESLAIKNHCGTLSEEIGDIAERPTGYACKLRLLVLYTPAANQSEANINSRIQLAVQQTRQALANSGVSPMNFDVVLAGTAQVNYTEDPYNSSTFSGISKDLNNMLNLTALRNQVTTLRNQYNADVVMMMIRSNPESTKGIAYLYNPSFPTPFGVVQSGWATNSGYTFAHEFGHIMGGRHENSDDPAVSIAHAHQWNYTVRRGFWPFYKYRNEVGKTITYQATAGDGTVRLRYSNPDRYEDGQPTGIANDRDAARQFNNVGCEMSELNNTVEPFSAVIGGPGPICVIAPANVWKLTGVVSGPAGTYQYEWSKSPNGINSWVVVGNTDVLVIGPTSSLGNKYYRLKVTSPNNQVLYLYRTVTVYDCRPPHGHGQRTAAGYNNAPLLAVSPNPAAADVRISVTLPEATSSEIAVYDVLGKMVRKVYTGTLPAGTQELSTDVQDLPDGTYFVKFVSSGYTNAQKLSIRH